MLKYGLRIFVAYAFADDWIPRLICPLIESLGFEVETGRELAGQKLDEGVKRKIEGCDDWVMQEYTHADTLGKLVVAVRETNVDFQGLLAGNRQWIALDPDNRLAATVELCRALRKWHSGIDIELKLNTQSFVDAILGRVMDRKYRCLYVLRHREGREMARIENAAILPRTGGLFVYAKNVPKDAFIEFTVEFDGETWTSLGREVQTIEIELKKEGEA